MNDSELNLSTQDLSATPGFSTLAKSTLEELIDCAGSRRLEPGEVLFEAGEPYHGQIYLVARGSLEVRRSGEEREHPPVGYLVGLSGYFSRDVYAATAVAREPGLWLGVIAHTALEALEQRHGELADAFNRMIGRTLRQRRSRPIQASGFFSHHAGQLMSTPLLSCPASTSLRDAVKLMDDSRHGSVVIDAHDGSHHLLSFRGVARYLARTSADAASVPVSEAQQALPTVDVNDPIWRVQDLQQQAQVRYVLVKDADQPAGIISQTDLVNILSSPQLQMAAKIRACGSYRELRGFYDAMVDYAATGLKSHRFAHDAVLSLSAAHLSVQQRCVTLTLEELEAEGLGRPPAAYALMIMGSGGRREMLLDPDQDNGLILSDDAAGDAGVREWFRQFCERLNRNLDTCGYILCPGKIMANNTQYHKSLSEWQQQIRTVAQRPNEKAARWANIIFDFDTLHGDESLTRSLRNSLLDSLQNYPRLLQFMVDDDAQGRAPLGWFDRLLTQEAEDGREIVDIKRNGLRIVVNAARIMSLSNRIGRCHTQERISELVRCGFLSEDHGATILDAYDELLGILLNQQIRQRRAGNKVDKLVAPQDLLRPEREALRVAMRAVNRFQEKLQDTIGPSGL